MKAKPLASTRGTFPTLAWEQAVAGEAILDPVRFLFTAAEVVTEPCTLAQVLETCAYHAAPGDHEAAVLLEKHLGTRTAEWPLTGAAVRGLAYVGGARAESSLRGFLDEVRADSQRLDQKIEALKQKHARLPQRLLRQRSHLRRVEEAIIAAQAALPVRAEPIDGFNLIAERLLGLRDRGKHNPLPVLRKLSSKSRRAMHSRRKNAAEGLLSQLVPVLEAEQHRSTLELLVREGDLRGFSLAALDKLAPALSDREFVELVREPWLTSKLRGYDRMRVQRMLETRGELGAQLIAEAYDRARKAAIKSQLLPSIIKDQPVAQQWETLVSLYRDAEAAPKLKEAALREMRRLKLPECAELFLEIVCDPRAPRPQVNLASAGLRDLGTGAFMRVLVEEGGLGKMAAQARGRKVQHRLQSLRRQMGDAELQEAFPEFAHSGKRPSAPPQSPGRPVYHLSAGFSARPLISHASAPRFECTPRRTKSFTPSTVGQRGIAWNLVLTHRREVACGVKSDTPIAGANRARSYALRAVSVLPPDRGRGGGEVLNEAFNRVFDHVRSPSERMRLGLAVGAVAEKLRHAPDAEVVCWN